MQEWFSQKTRVRVFFDSFLLVRFVAKRYILQHKHLRGQVGTCLHADATFCPVHQPSLGATVHNVTDGRTDGRHDTMMPIADHTV